MVTTTLTAGTMQQASIPLTPVTSSNGEMKSNEICNSSGAKRASDNRRSNKPIMEKRRRARINNCLNELKTLILDALKKDPARHSKLEKADILEMTVKHLQNIQRFQHPVSAVDSTAINKFSAGFRDCATEVGRFPGLDPIVKKKLLQHLSHCLNQTSKPQEVPKVQVHILPNSQQRNTEQVPHSGIIFSNSSGVQLVPTRLANGDIAFVLPTSTQNAQVLPSPVPLLVPIVSERTPSSISADSSYSPISSPEPTVSMFCSTQERPLSLVIRKRDRSEESSDERPWRP
ncbi:protein hairy-like isoform X2 [Cylas formicarius]|nr:protein hairy-like isoform X2 [Cylas formicarius]